jgi:ribosomal protein L40E
MQNEDLYPELVDYIFNYQSEFATEEERDLMRANLFVPKNANLGMLEYIKNKGINVVSENINSKQTDRFDAFKLKLVSRIYNEHKNELQLNLCPKCGKIARTPEAKQCRFCFYDWHSQ